jgi:hypothetical protein
MTAIIIIIIIIVIIELDTCSRTESFISTPGPLLVGRLTTKLITY